MVLTALLLLTGCGRHRAGLLESGGPLPPRADFDPPAMVRVADDLMRSGNAGNALKLYQSASAADPGNARAFAGLGAAYLALGGVDQAADAFAKALIIDPGLMAARLGHAQVLIRQGRPRAALVELESLALDDPRDAKVFNAMGIAFDLLGDNAEAQIRYGQGLDLVPNDVTLRGNLALSFAVSGDFDTAIGLLRALARSPGANAKIRQNLALAYALAGKFDLAESLARMDLPEDSVRANMTYIAQIRGLDRRHLAAAVILGDPDLLQPEEALLAHAAPTLSSTRPIPAEASPDQPSPSTAQARVEPPPPAKAPAGEPDRPHRLTLAGYQSRAQALVAWEALLRTNADLLENLAPEVRELKKPRNNGTRYVLSTEVIGPTPRARSLCHSLTTRGVACALGN